MENKHCWSALFAQLTLWFLPWSLPPRFHHWGWDLFWRCKGGEREPLVLNSKGGLRMCAGYAMEQTF